MKKVSTYLIFSVIFFIFITGIFFIVIGTSASTPGKYSSPPEVLPGVCILYLAGLICAVFISQHKEANGAVGGIRKYMALRATEKDRNAGFYMFLVLTAVQLASSFTSGANQISRLVFTNYGIGLAGNLIIAFLGALGLFGWVTGLLISKQLERKL